MKLLILIFAVAIVISISLKAAFIFKILGYDHEHVNLHSQESKYPLISKRVLQELPADFLINFLPLRRELKSTVKPYGDTFGFYFEYLPTGTSIGVNEKAEFESASLFKVPIIMSYYRYKERKNIKDDPVVPIQKMQIDDSYGDLFMKGPGYKIGLDEAVKLAIVESDNTAVQVVASMSDKEDLEFVYEGLDIELRTEDHRPIISAKAYTSVLKSLFYSSVLSLEHSQKILDLMTKTEFNDKLPAGVDKDVLVAHKIGVLDEGMYMDCGIVYVPRRQYALCMVSASDEATARKRMVDVSKKIYKYVSTRSDAKVE